MGTPAPIPWPLSSAPGKSPQESSGRLINCYAEPLGATGPAKATWRRSPGLTAFTDTGQSGPRGGILVNNLIFAAYADKAITIDAGGAVNIIGNLDGTKRCTFARNNATPNPDIQAVDPDNGAFALTTGGVTSFNSGGDLPAPNSVSAQDDYFFWTIADGRVFAAGPNSTVVNTQTFTTVRSRADDQLLRAVPYKGVMLFFKQKSCEVYQNTANPFPAFPYSRLTVIDRGLIGRNAIAGWEDGVAQLYWVADNFGVHRLNGYEPEKVSPPDLDRLIEAAAKTDPDSLEASCYVFAGRAMWVLTGPGWSWEFNISTGQWNERASLLTGQLTRWRNTGGLAAFGRWIGFDVQSGQVVSIDPAARDELGALLLFRLESGPVVNFPNRARIASAYFDFVTGVGIATSPHPHLVEPRVGISWSRDNGLTFGNPLLRSLGRQSDTKTRVMVTNAGISPPDGMRWRVDIADAVEASFMGGIQSQDLRIG